MSNSALTPGVVLRSPKREYTIRRVLGQGGFGITYLVDTPLKLDNISFKGKFAIKEHFLQMLCAREPGTSNIHYLPNSTEEVQRSQKAFIAEAQRLQKLGINHHNIVEVNEVFEYNKTAYYVMEYIDGGSLADYVKAHGGRLSWSETAKLMRPICEAVAMLHSNKVAHYDIKPQNIMIQQDEDGLRPVLIDFGLAKHYDGQGQATSSIAAAGYTPGYAPMEQYTGLRQFSPATDVYALAATVCFCLTGHAPAKA
ncbi:MAG: serine/threonine protein kinase, partial [Muribaculaceae bacterium]